MKLSPLFFVGILVIGLCTPAFSQSVDQEYTLDQFYQAALKHAEKIGIAKEDLAIAEYTRKQALAVLYPTITTFGNYQHYNEEKEIAGTLLQPQWDSSYGVSLTQSFTLNGRELTALKIAEQGIEKSGFDLDAAKESYLYTVASAFFDVAKSQQAVQTATASVTRLTTHKHAVSIRLKLGDISKTELFRTEAELASANADLLKAKNTGKLAQAFLARLTGIPMPFKIRENDIPFSHGKDTELKELQKTAYEYRADLKSYAKNESIAAKQVKYLKGAYWPRVSIEGKWVFLDQDPDNAYALDESGILGATITWDIFDGGLRKSQVGEARLQHKQAKLYYDNAKRDISIEVEEALLNWQTQQSIMASLESSLRYAQENYTASIRLFDNGMANSVDVMDANTLLVTSERQLVEARYNLQLAVLGMERSIGVFLNNILNRLEH